MNVFITMLAILLSAILAWPANAANLKVTLTPDSIQIDNTGSSTGLTGSVKDSSNVAVAGAAIVYSTSPASCTAPGGATSIGDGSFSSIFTGPVITTTIVCKITATATLGADSGTATAIIVVGKGYAPLVPLPGIGTPTSFPSYLVGLYKLALMSIGIFAMMMILYGGFRYTASAGNPAYMGDAKDAIFSAILGLILAVISWLILSTVNPELAMIKNPGSVFNPYSTTTAAPVLTCAKEGVMTNRTCKCINGEGIIQTGPPPPYDTCNNACASSNRCIKADATIGVDQNITGMTIAESAKKFSIYDAPKENPIVVPDGSRLIIWGGRSVSSNPVNWWRFDIDGNDDGVYTFSFPGGADPWSWFIADYTWYFGKPSCVTSTSPTAITCPIAFEVEDNTGVKSIDKVYIRILKQ